MKKVILLCIVVCVLIVFALLLTPNPGLVQQIGTDSDPVTPVDPDITNPDQDTIKAVSAGVRQDGALVISTMQDNIVLSVANKNWQSLKFNPSNNLLAALAGEGAKDLYIYNLTTKELTQHTFYNQTQFGITGYDWQSDNVIYYSQGTGNENWLHRYDYENNEIKKVFRTFGSVVSFNRSLTRFVFAVQVTSGTDWEVYTEAGERLASITAQTLGAQFNLNTIKLLNNGILITSTDLNQQNTFFTYAYKSQEVTELKLTTDTLMLNNLSIICNGPLNNTFYVYMPDLINQKGNIYLLNTNLSSLQLLYSVAWETDANLSSFACGNNKFAVSNKNASGQFWQEVTSNQINKLDWALNYSQLTYIN